MNSFQELDLIKPLQKALADEGYQTPTPIQQQAIPLALVGQDILGSAQTGTGKTAAFALPILNRLGQKHRKSIPNRPFVLVLAPTRELAIQIGESFNVYGRHLQLRHTVVFGGVSQVKQVRALNRGAHILIATPGRLLDLMNQGYIELDKLETFVLDEADRMLDMGFLPDLKRIISQLPARRHSLFFSATLPPKIMDLAQSLLREPAKVAVSADVTNTEKIEQHVHFVSPGNKRSKLHGILREAKFERALVFTRTKRGANLVAGQLEKAGFSSAVIHGNKSQNARQRALEDFRSKKASILVATDVAARGIDVDDVSYVFNYDLPVEPEAYVHRIGRTGRAGAEGIAVSFCCSHERRDLQAIERLIDFKMTVVSGQSEGGDRSEPSRGGTRRPATAGSGKPRRPRSGPPADRSQGAKPKRRRRRQKPTEQGGRVQRTS